MDARLDAQLFLRQRLTAFGTEQALNPQASCHQGARIAPAPVTLQRLHPAWTHAALISAHLPRPALALASRRCRVATPETRVHSRRAYHPPVNCRRATEEARTAGCYATRLPQQMVALGSAVSSVNHTSASISLACATGAAGAAAAAGLPGLAGLGGLGDAWSATRALIDHRRVRRDALSAMHLHSAAGDAFIAQVRNSEVPTHNPTRRAKVAQLAPAWLATRKAQQTLHVTRSAGKELALDALRYDCVTWCTRAASLTRQYAGVVWAGLASSILGVVGGTLQAVSGAMKLHAARQSLQRIQSARYQCNVAQLPKGGMKISCRAVLQHRQHGLERQSAAARSKQSKALAELATGTIILTLGAVAFAFPPVAIGMLAAGLIYAGYRVTKGIQGHAAAQRSAAAEAQRRTAAACSDAHLTQRTQTLLNAGGRSTGSALRMAHAEMLEENSHYALRTFADGWRRCTPHHRSRVMHFLIALGVDPLDVQALELLLDQEDATRIGQRLAQLLECPVS